MTAAEAARKIGVSEQTYYWWRKEYGGMQGEQAKRLKTLEQENVRLKRLVAEKELFIQRMTELALQYGRYGYRRITALLRNEGLTSESQAH
jgi:transposase-like protein